MAIIYGSPVIILSKSDRSEQWLLNSTVNPSYFGADKNFNVNFTSNGTNYYVLRLIKSMNGIIYAANANTYALAGSGGGMEAAYRQITFEKPATGDLLTWLEANAVRLPLTGTWVFNETLNSVTSSLWGNVNFTCSNASFKAMGYDPASKAFGYQASDGSGVIGIYNLTDNVWTNAAYRTITFTKLVKYEGNEEFVKWFTDNAQPSATLSLDMNWSDSGFDAVWLSSNSPPFLTYTSSNGTTATGAPSSSITSYTIPANSVVTIYLPGGSKYAYPQLTGNYKNFTWITNPTTGHDAKFSFTVPQGKMVTLNAKVVTVAGAMTNLPS